MPGTRSSAPAGNAPDAGALLNLSVHSLPSPDGDARAAARTRRGRWQMLAVLLVCAAPVLGSYLAYFVARPGAATNYGDLIAPPRPLPAELPLRDLDGRPVAPAGLRGQWLLVVVSGGTCDPACERRLWLQRQLHETLGREKDRVDKLWLLVDAAAPRRETLRAVGGGGAGPAGLAPATVLRVEPQALAGWLAPAAGNGLEDHLYLVDPRGDWMLRMPAGAEPARVKRDVDRLLRASAGWDRAGR